MSAVREPGGSSSVILVDDGSVILYYKIFIVIKNFYSETKRGDMHISNFLEKKKKKGIENEITDLFLHNIVFKSGVTKSILFLHFIRKKSLKKLQIKGKKCSNK